MSYSPLIQSLVESLCCLPGVGPKSAQRMAMQLLERQRDAGLALSAALVEAMERAVQAIKAADGARKLGEPGEVGPGWEQMNEVRLLFSQRENCSIYSGKGARGSSWT